MATFREDRNQVFDGKGKLLEEKVVQVDVTREVNAEQLRSRLVQALTANQSRIQAAKPLTAAGQASAAYDNTIVIFRQLNALIRLRLDHLDDITDT